MKEVTQEQLTHFKGGIIYEKPFLISFNEHDSVRGNCIDGRLAFHGCVDGDYAANGCIDGGNFEKPGS